MRKKQLKPMLLMIFMISIIIPFLFTRGQEKGGEESPTETSAADEKDEMVMLNVPLENQFYGIALDNGCEVTALSMLLNYYGYQTTKNELANQLDYVPLFVDESHRGNPKDGFVGNIYEGDLAMGVAVEPIAKVAKEVVQKDYKVVSGRELSFDEVMSVVQKETPVWIIATLELQVPKDSDFFSWNTTSGKIYVTSLIHSVVITGVDGDTVYVNDPYGYKNRKVSRDDLEEIYEKMGQQSLYLQSDS